MPSIRLAAPADVPVILQLIRSLAIYEREAHQVRTTEADLLHDGFGDRPCFECLIAEDCDAGTPDGKASCRAAGFALYFPNYSTWRGRGIYLEDLFVLPEFRRRGIGKALLARVAARAIELELPRLAWAVLEWNQPAFEFYQTLGAQLFPDWRIMRISDDALQSLANPAAASEQIH